MRRRDSASDARWEVYARQQADWEPVAEFPSDRHIRLDTSPSPEDTMWNLVFELFGKALGAPLQGTGKTS